MFRQVQINDSLNRVHTGTGSFVADVSGHFGPSAASETLAGSTGGQLEVYQAARVSGCLITAAQ